MEHVKALVTGGSGFIGSHLVERLVKEGHKVSVLDIEPFRYPSKINFIKGDVCDLELLESIFKTGEYDVVYHLASMVGVKNYCQDPLKTISTNIIGTRNIIEVSLYYNTRILYSSTSEVYGKNPNVPWKENADRVLGSTSIDRWCYSSSKSICEHMLFAINRRYGLPISIVRYFNVYGPRQKPIFVIPSIIKRIIENKQPLIYDDGEKTRCYLYIDDAIDATMLIDNGYDGKTKVFNVGSDIELSVNELMTVIQSASGTTVTPKQIDTSSIYSSYEDLPRRVPDITKLKELKWKPNISLEEGIKKTYEWWCKEIG